MKEDSLADRAYAELRRKILSNQLLAGSRLKEDEWSKKLDVNRMALREALMRLQGEQLLTKGEKGGFFIKSLTIEDIRDIRELREILETGAIRILIGIISEEQLAELERICDDFTAMYERGYFSGACEADVKFHETLITYSGNKKLTAAYFTSNIPLFHQKLGLTQTHMDDYELTDAEHREIVKALRTRSLQQAERTLIKHLVRGEVTTLDLIS
ncbi:GntR family transcriptional regulator [Ravibacter arvi]|uniref:GntR family transcriptional regulator n=1 Tax=Ravibacter arvi TaxID=2051041 RepID=A0ABP8LXL1_9BACT